MDLNDQTPQETVAPQTIQTSSPEMETSSSLPKILISVFGIIIVLGLIGGAYYLGIKKGSAISNGNMGIKLIAATPTSKITQMISSPSPAQSLKLFTNGNLGGSFLYPSDWQQNKVSPSNTVDISFTKLVCKQGQSVCLNYYVSILSYPTTIPTTQQFVNQYYPGSTGDTTVPTTDFTTLNGVDYKKSLDQYNTFPDYFTIQNGRIYVISTSISGQLQDTTQDQTNNFLNSVEQLLNSFTFTPSNKQ